nr:GNAT family protein [Vitiosangium sp. GDMCC 1.1324]
MGRESVKPGHLELSGEGQWFQRPARVSRLRGEPREWGQGYGREAVGRVVEFGFTSLELHRLEADVDPRNSSSIQVLERLGFQREGYQRERYLLNGERQDAVLYGLLRPEWRLAPAR